MGLRLVIQVRASGLVPPRPRTKRSPGWGWRVWSSGCLALWDPEELGLRESLSFPGALQTEPPISGCQRMDFAGRRKPLKVLEPDRSCLESALGSVVGKGKRDELGQV